MKRIWLNVFQELDTGYSRWLNMGYLKAALNRIPDVEVQVNFYKLNEVDVAVSDAVQTSPSIIGLTVLQFNCQAAIEFSEKLKKQLSKVHITMGNSFASTYPLYLLENYSSIDSIVIGEGEFTLVELCSCILTEKPLCTCKGIYYRDKDGIQKTDKRELKNNLDEYPIPDRSFCAYKSNIFGVLGSRGCYGNCTFCDINTLFKDMVRTRSISNILDEIEFLVKNWNAKYITFYDSTFCINKKEAFSRLEEFYYGLLERNLNINFSINLRSEQMDDKLMNIILKLNEIGLDYLMFGFEAGNDEDLAFYGKPSKVKNHLNTLELLRQNKILTDNYDISISYGFINYHPYSKIENVKKNLQFLRDSGLFITFGILNSRFLNFGNGIISKKIENDGLLLSLPGQPIIDPLAYRFIDPKIQALYDIGRKLEEQFSQLKILDPDEWISVYRRWKRFYPQQENRYAPIFDLYIKDRNLISEFLINLMWDVVEKVENGYSNDKILEIHKKIIAEQIEYYKDDCKKFVTVYQKFNIDLFKINETLVR